ncbi:MAG: hypothetical protein IKJ19_05805 [Clostridia bacterium]|nr:hypothetical protein [Clostridia bacterium]
MSKEMVSKENSILKPNNTIPLDQRTEEQAIIKKAIGLVEKGLKECKESSKAFYKGCLTEIDALDLMIKSENYTPAEKKDFEKRMAILVDLLDKKDNQAKAILIGGGLVCAAILGYLIGKKK